jgi:hypothetical protein
MPLHVEILYNEYNFVGAFAVAALLASLSLVTLLVKKSVELSAELKARRMAKAASGARSSLVSHSHRPGAALSARPNESRA